ncbi:UNVERIFIED_CONTAM: hypothetical protein GTU68_008859 [Idotea baltica]|nr:hypothetical protein [Idotea baltica]
MLSAILFACSPQSEESTDDNTSETVGKSQAEIDDEKIQSWINKNNSQAESLPSGVHYIIDEPGSDEHPTLSSFVTVHYRGSNLDGVVFESSFESNKPLKIVLSRLIEGWKQGIPLIGKGGKIKLIIPSGLAYGQRALTADVGPNSVLVFDIELLDFK